MQGETDVSTLMRDFDYLASLLDVSLEERLGILNVTAEYLYDLQHASAEITEELRRRLVYVLPVLRRMVTNSQVVFLPHILVSARQNWTSSGATRTGRAEPTFCPA